jgi:hypothetical protein
MRKIKQDSPRYEESISHTLSDKCRLRVESKKAPVSLITALTENMERSSLRSPPR